MGSDSQWPVSRARFLNPSRPVWIYGQERRVGRAKVQVGDHTDGCPEVVAELAESGAGDEVIMSIAGRVSRAMLSRYSHVRMEAKRRALDEIVTRQCAPDDKRSAKAERMEQGAGASLQAAAVQ